MINFTFMVWKDLGNGPDTEEREELFGMIQMVKDPRATCAVEGGKIAAVFDRQNRRPKLYRRLFRY